VACGTHDTCNTDCWIKAVPACGGNAQFHKPGFYKFCHVLRKYSINLLSTSTTRVRMGVLPSQNVQLTTQEVCAALVEEFGK